jgi:hypothetical protein
VPIPVAEAQWMKQKVTTDAIMIPIATTSKRSSVRALVHVTPRLMMPAPRAALA